MAAVAELSGEAIVGGTLDGIITSWNPAAEMMFGYSSREIIGTSGRLVLPEDRTKGAMPVLAGMSAGHEERIETMCIRRDGTLVPVSLGLAPIREEGGAIVGLSAIVRDLTGPKQGWSPPGAITE